MKLKLQIEMSGWPWGGRLSAATRCSRCLLSLFLLIAAMSGAVKGQSSCLHQKDVVEFLGFIPRCHSQQQPSPNGSSDGDIISRSAAREILETCDVLVRPAVELAVERINRNPDVLANSTLRVLQLPDFNEVSSQSVRCKHPGS